MLEIEKLTNINGVSGNEDKVRETIISMISDYADSITVDSMGSIIALKKGRNPNGKKLILSAHMDEVGLIISDITDDGYLKFKTVGGIDDRILLCQRVLIGENEVCGVTGIKAVHLQTKDERKNVIKSKSMYIDIGASSLEEAEKLVSKGDYAAFDSLYTELGDGRIKAKALDDRVGCAILCELIKEEVESDIYFCFCVQEETGLRGASVIARRIDADAAIIFESTTASDTAQSKEHMYSTTLGMGPAISVMDRGSYSHAELNRFIIDTAKKGNIKYQLKKSSMGGNDARAYQANSSQCMTAVISLPTRYIHSPVSCADREDIENMYLLSKNITKNIHNFWC